jgi:hypothetical protein
MATSATTTARYVTPFTRNTAAVPTVPTITPAIAGPTMREPVKVAVFRLIAFVRSSGPTISR